MQLFPERRPDAPARLAPAALLAAVAAPGPATAAPAAALTSLCLASRPPTTPDGLWRDWSLAPEIVVPLLALLLFMPRFRAAGSRGRAALFLAGWLLLAVALVSPLCRMAATLASAHMVQHVILVALAPPLLILGLPPGAFRRLTARSPAVRWLARPIAAAALYAAAIWLAHAPAIYQGALQGAAAHLLLLALLLAASLLFWAVLLETASSGAALLAAFLTMVHTTLLGALLTFASAPWYPLLALRGAGWGLTPLDDQQLAGLIMWVPMSSIYLAAALAITARTLNRLEERSAPR